MVEDDDYEADAHLEREQKTRELETAMAATVIADYYSTGNMRGIMSLAERATLPSEVFYALLNIGNYRLDERLALNENLTKSQRTEALDAAERLIDSGSTGADMNPLILKESLRHTRKQIDSERRVQATPRRSAPDRPGMTK